MPLPEAVIRTNMAMHCHHHRKTHYGHTLSINVICVVSSRITLHYGMSGITIIAGPIVAFSIVTLVAATGVLPDT